MEHVIESLLTDFERGRMTRRQAKSTPGRSAINQGNHQKKCRATKCNRGTPLSLPALGGAVCKWPSHSTASNWRRKPGKCSSVQTYQGATSNRKIDK